MTLLEVFIIKILIFRFGVYFLCYYELHFNFKTINIIKFNFIIVVNCLKRNKKTFNYVLNNLYVKPNYLITWLICLTNIYYKRISII